MFGWKRERVDYENVAFPKNARKRDKKFLAEVRKRPCLICFRCPSDAAHYVSRGAGGGDTEDNVIPLCRTHHREQHRIGIESFAEKYQAFRAWRDGVKK